MTSSCLFSAPNPRPLRSAQTSKIRVGERVVRVCTGGARMHAHQARAGQLSGGECVQAKANHDRHQLQKHPQFIRRKFSLFFLFLRGFSRRKTKRLLAYLLLGPARLLLHESGDSLGLRHCSRVGQPEWTDVVTAALAAAGRQCHRRH